MGVLDLQNALDGRRLCENGVGVLEEVGVPSWTSPGAVDRTEWVSQIRTATTIFGPYQLQEASHAPQARPRACFSGSGSSCQARTVSKRDQSVRR